MNWEIQHILPAQTSGGGTKISHSFSEMGTKENQILVGRRTFIVTHLVCFRFQMHCFLSEVNHLNVQIWTKVCTY